jgi:thiol-disulfide isomerase/thioredoxin
VLASQGQRGEAIAFLTEETKRWLKTSIAARIQKNLNLLSLVGKPAPALDVREGIGGKPRPLSAFKGKPVLLFFWAHWCGDCKADVPVLARIQSEFGPRGLVLIGPTQHYGYVAGGEEAPPDRETRYIAQIRRDVYGPLKMEVPLSRANFVEYGASTTPTFVLVDAGGIVRLYLPGAMTYAELTAALQPLVH